MEEIVLALRYTHRDDLEKIRRYVAWMKVRRRVNDRFYFAAHWLTRPKGGYHWI